MTNRADVNVIMALCAVHENYAAAAVGSTLPVAYEQLLALLIYQKYRSLAHIFPST